MTKRVKRLLFVFRHRHEWILRGRRIGRNGGRDRGEIGVDQEMIIKELIEGERDVIIICQLEESGGRERERDCPSSSREKERKEEEEGR